MCVHACVCVLKRLFQLTLMQARVQGISTRPTPLLTRLFFFFFFSSCIGASVQNSIENFISIGHDGVSAASARGCALERRAEPE